MKSVKIDLNPIRAQIKAIEEEIKSPLPTPPVGHAVVWYRAAEVKPNAEIAAVVTAIEAPGKVTITTFRPLGMPEFNKRGVHHVSHTVHKQRHNAVSRTSGAWDYVQGANRPKGHYQLHLDKLETRKEACEKQLEDALAANRGEDKPESKELKQTTSSA